MLLRTGGGLGYCLAENLVCELDSLKLERFPLIRHRTSESDKLVT